MAGNYTGYFLKGLAGGLQSGINMGQQLQEMKWQKIQRKKLEEKQAKMIEAGNLWNAKIKEIYADGNITEEETNQLTTMYLSSGYEFMEHNKNAMNYISGMKDKEFNQELEWMDLFFDWTAGMNPNDISGVYDNFEQQFVTTEKSKTLFAANKRIQKKKYEALQAQPIAEVFPTAEAVQAKYPNAGYKYDSAAGGYVPTFQKQEATPTTTDYSSAINYLLKFKNAPPDTFSRIKAGYQKQFPKIDMASITQEALKEPETITEPKITTPAPTSTENIREDILNADTFADANRIYKNYADKYDETALGITDLKQEWASGQINYLNKVKKSIENLLVDRGDKGQWLNNKPVTQETVGLEFKGERPASEIYEMLYKSYIEYLEKLGKLGIDVSQFPELLPLGEIEKVGRTEGFFGWGIQKGDYKSIYK